MYDYKDLLNSIQKSLAEECPPATQDISLNLANRKICVDKACYGPANPQLDNEDFWQHKADLFQTTIDEAKTMRCKNCAAFVPDAISNFGRMKGQMSYDTFLRKLYNMCKRKGAEFVAALPEASKEQLGIKKKVKADDGEIETPEVELQEYKDDFYGMSVSSIKAIITHAQTILDSLENPQVKENLTESFLQGKIAITEDYMRTIHDYVMFSEAEADTSMEQQSVNPEDYKKKQKLKVQDLPKSIYQKPSYPGVTTPNSFGGDKPGLWDNIRKKKERMGKNYRPAKPGDKDRPDPKQWKKLT